jgi:Na+/H+ antiporter NhaD/arsenite permease-like protein
MQKTLKFIKANAVMLIAFIAAAVTTFIIPPDKKYIGYFDFKTLSCLFAVLAVVSALRNIRFFYTLAKSVVRLFKNTDLPFFVSFTLTL